MSNKTPVTIFQELCVINGFRPSYKLIHDGSGTLRPFFKYKISMRIEQNEFSAIGTGHSKQTAKHDCAGIAVKNLAKMGIVSKDIDLLQTDQEAPAFEDSIKKLLEICSDRKLPLPTLEVTEDSGPAHARQFVVTCTLSSFKETATAKTKRSAKHLAAAAMIEYLNNKPIEEVMALAKTVPAPPKPVYDINKALKQKHKKVLLGKRHISCEDPFKYYEKDKCDKCRDILKDSKISLKEKTEKALEAMDLEFEVSEIPAVKPRRLFMFETAQPEYCITGYSYDEMYAQVVDLFKTLLRC